MIRIRTITCKVANASKADDCPFLVNRSDDDFFLCNLSGKMLTPPDEEGVISPPVWCGLPVVVEGGSVE